MASRMRFGLLAVMTLVLTAPMFGQGAQVPDLKAAAYDVVTVKPHKPGDGSTSISIDDDIYRASNVSLKMLIRYAYDLKTEDQITVTESWAGANRYDVQAKIDPETMAAMKGLKDEERDKIGQAMMQAMLAERFHLKVHHETKELPIYALVVAKSGLKLKTSSPENEKDGSMNSNNQHLTATGIGMDGLSGYLSQRLHRMVQDKTGLTGKYDFTLEWAPDEAAGEASAAAAGASPLPSLMTAVEEQLGLRLETAKGPVDLVVVEGAELPTVD